MDHPFRGAAFGGFNRQDVLTYLENTAREAAQQREALEQQLEQQRQAAESALRQIEEQSQQILQLQQANQRLQEEKDALSGQLEQTNVALSTSRTERSQLSDRLAQLENSLAQAQTRIAALEPDAEAYAALKERTAGVELEAHRRAQTVQEQAEEQARQLRRQMERWMQRVEHEYDVLRTQVESTVSHAADQLDKAGAALKEVGVLLEAQDVALDSLAQAYADSDLTKVKAPMPIPES